MLHLSYMDFVKLVEVVGKEMDKKYYTLKN